MKQRNSITISIPRGNALHTIVEITKAHKTAWLFMPVRVDDLYNIDDSASGSGSFDIEFKKEHGWVRINEQRDTDFSMVITIFKGKDFVYSLPKNPDELIFLEFEN